VTEIYTREGRLWGVPQLVDSIALFYNKELLEAADVDVTALEWSPDPAADTLTPALVELTVDDEGNHPGEEGFDPDDVAVWGFNAQNDLQAIWLGFLVQNGGEFQDGDTYTFDSPAGVEAFEYLVDLINAHGVAPPAELTNDDANASRDLFARGELALLQTGQYALEEVARIDSFEWGIAPLIEGPRGRVGVVHGVAAVGNAASSRSQATSEALAWLGSAEGQRPLGEAGVGLPAALGAAATFTDYWDARGVDASEFVAAASGPAAPAPVGRRSNAGLDALATVLPEMFEGRVPVAQALEQAQQAANEAIAD